MQIQNMTHVTKGGTLVRPTTEVRTYSYKDYEGNVKTETATKCFFEGGHMQYVANRNIKRIDDSKEEA